jgi:hypothetical protein
MCEHFFRGELDEWFPSVASGRAHVVHDATRADPRKAMRAKPQVRADVCRNRAHERAKTRCVRAMRVDARVARRSARRATQRAQEMLDLRARIRFDARVSRAAEVT